MVWRNVSFILVIAALCTAAFVPTRSYANGDQQTPIVVDVARNGFNLTDSQHGVLFDLDADGVREQIPWTAAGSDDGWLVWDRNNSTIIENGTELWGSATTPQMPASEPNGFAALAVYDRTIDPAYPGNGDGWLGPGDTLVEAQKLRIWIDSDHDGLTDAGELRRLGQLNIKALDLNYTSNPWFDANGNEFRYQTRAYYNGNSSEYMRAQDVILRWR